MLIRSLYQKEFYINKCIINIESNDELKEINITARTCYFWMPYKNIFVYNIASKTLIDELDI